MIDYVGQKEDGGCMVACVAMVTGCTYEVIRRMCEPSYKDGIHEVIADSLLGSLGYAVIRRYKHIPWMDVDRHEWPCLPFAPAHICLVHATAGPHAIVMLSTGDVYDPWKRERTTVRHPDYKSISWIAGVYKVATVTPML